MSSKKFGHDVMFHHHDVHETIIIYAAYFDCPLSGQLYDRYGLKQTVKGKFPEPGFVSPGAPISKFNQPSNEIPFDRKMNKQSNRG